MFDGENMIERFFETLKTDETIFSSLSQIGLLSLIVIVSFFLMRSVEKSSKNKKIGTQEETYIQDEEVIVEIITFIAFAISSLLLVGEIFRVFLIILLTFIGTFV